MPQIRRTELHRRRVRREKLARLRQRYHRAESDAERARVVDKILRVAPWLKFELQRWLQAGPAGPRPARPRPPSPEEHAPRSEERAAS